MKTSKKLFSALLLIFIATQFISVTLVSAENNTADSINYSEVFGAGNLEIDWNQNPASGVKVDISGKRLVDSQNLGRTAAGNGKYIYDGILNYEFTVRAYTSVSENEAFANPTNAKKSIRILKMDVANSDYRFPAFHKRTQYYYNLEYYTWETGALSAKTKGYDGPMKVDVSFVSHQATQDKFEIHGLSVKSATVNATISNKEVFSSGNYQTDSEKQHSFTHVAADTIDRSQGANSFTGDAQNKVNDWIAARKIGVNAVGDPIQGVSLYGGQGKADPYNGDLKNLWLTIKPDVTLITQVISYTKCDLLAVSTGNWAYSGRVETGSTTPVESGKSVTRIVGWKVKNIAREFKVKVSVRVTTTMEYTSTDGENVNPEEVKLYQGDQLWDTWLDNPQISVDTTQSVFESAGNWLADYWWVIILVAVIGLVIYFAPQIAMYSSGFKSGRIKQLQFQKFRK